MKAYPRKFTSHIIRHTEKVPREDVPYIDVTKNTYILSPSFGGFSSQNKGTYPNFPFQPLR
jgi:hypothetical protein